MVDCICSEFLDLHCYKALNEICHGIVQQTQTAMENFLSAINEIDASSSDVIEDIHQTRACALERKTKLEEDRDRFQRAACKVLDMLNVTSLMNVPNGDYSSAKEDSSQ
ncbi:hypothetical protein O6H91_17G012700 [Diphasiastrum complanatum]|uniref:Uncharacterized protein n=1 Tax=Diphasiastrum complanatum TaxID=34168 RepID=A0ACC2B4A3_DIPCM|nr:hypothetical protein O6H91_17G012700 [Diphasiastrum complanatum]